MQDDSSPNHARNSRHVPGYCSPARGLVALSTTTCRCYCTKAATPLKEIMKRALACAFFMLTGSFASSQSATIQAATIKVGTTRVVNHVSPRMYASFVEMMAEDVKWGMTAEMVHDRSFEEAPDYLGLPAEWQLEPDERNDNVGAIRFTPTTEEAYPRINAATKAQEHGLKITLAPADNYRHSPRSVTGAPFHSRGRDL